MATPRVVGATVDSAQVIVARDAEEVGLEVPPRVAIGARRYSEQRRSGRVVSQRPRPGGNVRSGGTVDVVVSKGTAFAIVPTTVGQELAAARASLRRQGFTSKVERESTFFVEKGQVMASAPDQASRAKRPGPVTLTASSGPRPDAITIFGDTAIGSFGVRSTGPSTGGKLGEAVAAFGEPSRTPDADVFCSVVWSSLGADGSFYDLGAADPCSDEGGDFSFMTMRGPRFVTDRGIAIGSSESDLLEKYPEARAAEGGYILAEEFSPIGDGGNLTTLFAEVSGGSVSAITMAFPSGGD